MLVCLWTFFTGCRTEIKPTSVDIQHPVRHYYPIPSGDELSVIYQLKNTGKHPLVISEIQTSCGCIVHIPAKHIVPPGDSTSLRFTYRSEMNTGYASHQIRLFGNFDTGSMRLLEFDVHIVPPSDFIRDYEEMNEGTRYSISRSSQNNYWY